MWRRQEPWLQSNSNDEQWQILKVWQRNEGFANGVDFAMKRLDDTTETFPWLNLRNELPRFLGELCTER
ncbi:hypothetical protein AAVH_25470 [Aphelenchoides avenae]|nr:hypothetical protein AAVH_38492 [Aphelenchus avenae]KAH7707298.1 hypothetical protein AAVH_25470 [Aphelenchus avenae]